MEMTRRQVAFGGMLLAVLPVFHSGIGLAPTPYLYDPSFDPTGGRIHRAIRAGYQTHRLDGDIGPVAHRLDETWRDYPSAIVGLTDSAGWFIISQVARRRGLELFRREGALWAFAAHEATAERHRLATIFSA